MFGTAGPRPRTTRRRLPSHMLRLSRTAHRAHELCPLSLLLEPAPLRRVPLADPLRPSRAQAAHRLDRTLHQARQSDQVLHGLNHITQLGELRQVLAWREKPGLRHLALPHRPPALLPLGATPQTLPG